MTAAIVPPNQIRARCENLRTHSAAIVFTNGVFDLLHPGHVSYLTEAHSLGTHLIVALNSDDSVRRLKGDQRPLMRLEERMEILSALSMVNTVTWFDEDTPEKLIRIVQPAILVKGGDWELDEIVGKEFVESLGGRVLTIPFVPGYSTTELIQRIIRLSQIK